MMACAAHAARAAQPPGPDDWHVACLCAQWCNVCRQLRADFEALAGTLPQVRWHWVDVEEEDAAMQAADLEVDTFPTVLIAHGPQVRFFGPQLPQARLFARLLQSVQDGPHDSGTDVPESARMLWVALHPALLQTRQNRAGRG